MKKLFTILAFVLFAQANNAQSFNGVPLSGDLPTAIARFKAKGFTLTKMIESGCLMKGTVANYDVELYIFKTLKTNKVFKAVVYFNEDISWGTIKSKYEKFVNVFVEKYGEPVTSAERFISPYYEGDGYEMTGLANEKVEYFSIWMDVQNMNLMVEISKYKQLKLTYENKELIEVNRKERAEIENNSF
jgi:hypothetical protein